jgi:hypothetical protein
MRALLSGHFRLHPASPTQAWSADSGTFFVEGAERVAAILVEQFVGRNLKELDQMFA